MLGENSKREKLCRRLIYPLYDNVVIVRIETNNNRPFLIKAMAILPFRNKLFLHSIHASNTAAAHKAFDKCLLRSQNTLCVGIFEDMYFVMKYNKGCCRFIYTMVLVSLCIVYRLKYDFSNFCASLK